MNKIRLMLVDDHPMIREGLTAMLSGCEDIQVVGSCGDSESAQKMALSENPDIILMDIKMEGTNGIETSRMILAQRPEIKIIFLTVFEDTESIRLALQAGAAGYLLKHVSREKLIESIRRAYRGETIIDPAVLNKIVTDYTKLTRSTTVQQEKPALKEIADLTPREHEILHYLARGLTNKEISVAAHLAVDTVKTHLRNIFRKLGVKNRSQAISLAIKLYGINPSRPERENNIN